MSHMTFKLLLETIQKKQHISKKKAGKLLAKAAYKAVKEGIDRTGGMESDKD